MRYNKRNFQNISSDRITITTQGEELVIVYTKLNNNKFEFRPKLLLSDENKNRAKIKILTGIPVVDWRIEEIARQNKFKNTLKMLEYCGKQIIKNNMVDNNTYQKSFLLSELISKK